MSQNQESGSGTTRRRLLGGAATAAALAAASVALPPNVRQALADPPPNAGHGGLGDIKHVVMLMQENRTSAVKKPCLVSLVALVRRAAGLVGLLLPRFLVAASLCRRAGRGSS